MPFFPKFFGQNIIATGGSDGNSNDAFYACPQLRKVTLNNRLETLGRYTFQSCNSLEDINLGDATGLKTIMLKAFQNADNLRSLELPESVSLIEESAFEGCDSLRSFTFLGMSSLTNIPKNCFAGCVSLENITLPDAVKTLSAGCFYNTPSLTEIIFGTGITSLSDDNYVFGYFNANLKKMTFPGAVYPFLKEYYLPSDIVLYVRPDLIDTYKENSSATRQGQIPAAPTFAAQQYRWRTNTSNAQAAADGYRAGHNTVQWSFKNAEDGVQKYLGPPKAAGLRANERQAVILIRVSSGGMYNTSEPIEETVTIWEESYLPT